MSHYRVLSWATGPLTLLESVAKLSDWQVTKMGKSSIFWLSSPFHHDSMIMAEHEEKSLGIALTTYRYRTTQTILQWFSSTPQKKKQEQVTKTFSKWKHVHVGMEPSKTSQTRWEWHCNTFTPSHWSNEYKLFVIHVFCEWCDGATLTIPTVQKSSEGSYHCVISNCAGTSTSNPAKLSIGKNPIMPVQLE